MVQFARFLCLEAVGAQSRDQGERNLIRWKWRWIECGESSKKPKIIQYSSSAQVTSMSLEFRPKTKPNVGNDPSPLE